MTGQQRPIHLLPNLHLLGMLALGVWWGIFFWQESPARVVLTRPLPEEALATRGPWPGSVAAEAGRLGTRLSIAVRASAADVLIGLSVLLLFGISSGVQVRRLDNWMHARSSGDAVAFRGQDLTSATIAANKKEQRGILR